MKNPVIFTLIFMCCFSHAKDAEIQYVADKIKDYSDSEIKVLILYNRWLYQCIQPDFIHTFMCEVESRTEEAKYWHRIKGETESSKYFDELEMVNSSGFMKEYVWIYHRNPEWSMNENLRLEDFKKWSMKNIPNHKPLLNSGIALVVKK